MQSLTSQQSLTTADLKDIQDKGSMRTVRMSHPEAHGAPDRTPVQVGEVWENLVTRERATILVRPWDNPAVARPPS